ncbi:formylglycine-generating enzyme family protein [Leucothrix mucor]|uniref:formylglycine-generating enzyme family protein n=1 Tax=Leucothrix mucor TaxID=45248 RepID=UPI0003B79E38|nr:formylglycine-generating enzyme family protein [Leucothrix mucor]
MESYIRQHKIYPDEFPESWASGWGEDEFGLWMAFTYKGIQQKFRWCEPGEFLMGSPQKETYRRPDESLHNVILSKGFWIADTTVTQALWMEVVNNNPSRFQGESRPVENVSWNDAQEFIVKMNDMKSELKLRLPTEAEWEYACRAGSKTPFCWGEQINSDLVNFEGTYPYKGGEISEYREHTVDVKSFHQNDWGLWQMHGNVSEWCQDWYGDYLRLPKKSPLMSAKSEGKLIRGGSWFTGGWQCRSAFRASRPPQTRSDTIGFRLIREC